MHQNIPNMVGQIATILAANGVNIEGMSNAAKNKVAYTIVDINQMPTAVAKTVSAQINAIEAVHRVRLLTR
jgi:D-3-phosphoglycerate dehydrogenase